MSPSIYFFPLDLFFKILFNSEEAQLRIYTPNSNEDTVGVMTWPQWKIQTMESPLYKNLL